MRRILACCFLWASLVAAGESPISRGDVVLGIVEDLAQASAKTPTYESGLRLAFRHNADGWAPICDSKPSVPTCKFPDADSPRPWRVMLEGVSIGQVSTSGWQSPELYKHAGLLRIVASSFSRQGVRGSEFSGWTDVEVFRPLIAMRGIDSAYRAWSIGPSTSSESATMFPLFVKSVPEIPSCRTDVNNKPIGKPMKTSISDVQMIRVLRSASSGERLVGMRVKRSVLKDCNETGEVGSDHWYLLSEERSPHELKYQRDDSGWPAALMPIEIGDFDGDGSDEALFWYSGYNEDGYILFYADFSKSI